MSLRLKQVTISGMNNVEFKTYDLSNFNYLHGKNGAGKSTVLKAIQLALLGYIPGINKTNSAIFEHCNGNKMFVSVQIERTESGSMFMIEREFVSEGGKITSSFRVVPDSLNIQDVIETCELPIFNFNQFRSMTANGIKDWFLSFLPPDGFAFSWEHELRNAVKNAKISRPVSDAVFDSMVSQIEEDSVTSIVNIRNANQFFKSKISEVKKQIQDIQGAIGTLIYYPEIDHIGESVQSAKAKLDEFTALKSKAAVAERSNKQRASIEEQIKQLSIESESVEEDEYIKDRLDLLEHKKVELSKLESELSALCMELDENKATLDSLNKVIEGNGVCPYSGSMCPTIVGSLQETEAKRDSVQRLYDIKDASVKRKILEIDDSKHRIDQLRKDISDRKADHEKLDKLKQELAALSEDTCFYTEKQCDEMIQEAQMLLMKAASNESYHNNLERFTSQKFELDMELELFKVWEKLTGPNELQAKVANEPFLRFADTATSLVSELLPNCKFKFNLESKSNSFSFGIERDEQYVPFDQLSAGEQCLVMIAFFCAVLETCHSSLPLLLVDDSLDHLDSENFMKVVDFLSSRPREVQAVFAGVQSIEGSDEMENVKVIEL